MLTRILLLQLNVFENSRQSFFCFYCLVPGHWRSEGLSLLCSSSALPLTLIGCRKNSVIAECFQVYGAATLSVNSFREELGSATSFESVATSSYSVFQPGSSLSIPDSPILASRISTRRSDYRFNDENRRDSSSNLAQSEVGENVARYINHGTDSGSNNCTGTKRSVLKNKSRGGRKVRKNSYQVNRNLRYQVINMNRKSGGILKRFVCRFYNSSAELNI